MKKRDSKILFYVAMPILITCVLCLILYKPVKKIVNLWTFSKYGRTINYKNQLYIGINEIINSTDSNNLLLEYSQKNRIENQGWKYIGFKIKIKNISKKDFDLYDIHFSLFLSTHVSQDSLYSVYQIAKNADSVKNRLLLDYLAPIKMNEIRNGFIFFKIPSDSNVMVLYISDFLSQSRFRIPLYDFVVK